MEHTPRRLRDPYPDGWFLYVNEVQPKRLLVFVHGFLGGPTKTWRQFPASGANSPWYRESHMLFVSYRSARDSIKGVADLLRDELPRLYPQLPDDLLEAGGARLGPEPVAPYSELVLVGHSLGGLVLRCMLRDVAQQWLDDRVEDSAAPRPPLLDAKLRLFSPASGGFRPAGLLGLVGATRAHVAMSLLLSGSSAYKDLQPDSAFLAAVRRRTETLVADDADGELEALRARIVWASPDNVVNELDYDTDFVSTSAQRKSHMRVCKPTTAFSLPRTFVETGSR
jgi:pimeloyl-ACP methyl ester carboxylesterase